MMKTFRTIVNNNTMSVPAESVDIDVTLTISQQQTNMNSLTEEAQNAVGTQLYPAMEMQLNDHPQIQSIAKQTRRG